MLTGTQLRAIMPRLPAARLDEYLPHLDAAMAEFAINSPARAAAFLAQLAHESGEFRWMEEIWGPTSAQRRYEPQSTLAARLGNTQPGDGSRFKGRGPIQLTGRANYQRFGQLLGIDLIASPERAASPDVAFRIAALYWANRGLNALADTGNFREITRRINGGFNGLADRMKYFERATSILGEALTKALPRRRGASQPTTAVPEEALSRGAEDIREFAAARRRKVRKTGKTARGAKASAKPKKAPARKTKKTAKSKRKVSAPKRKTSTAKRKVSTAKRKPAKTKSSRKRK
jgi:predicted chitinase